MEVSVLVVYRVCSSYQLGFKQAEAARDSVTVTQHYILIPILSAQKTVMYALVVSFSNHL